MICYRWAEGPKFYEEMSSWVVLALEASLQRAGQDPWLDRTHLPTDAKDLIKTVGEEMQRRKMVIICIGPRDLERCQIEGDFFRWEIDRAIQLEAAGKLKVVVVVYGIDTLDTLVRKTKALGDWGANFYDYITKHYLIFLRVDSLEKEVGGIIKALN